MVPIVGQGGHDSLDGCDKLATFCRMALSTEQEGNMISLKTRLFPNKSLRATFSGFGEVRRHPNAYFRRRDVVPSDRVQLHGGLHGAFQHFSCTLRRQTSSGDVCV
jgi:hypothetical protein